MHSERLQTRRSGSRQVFRRLGANSGRRMLRRHHSAWVYRERVKVAASEEESGITCRNGPSGASHNWFLNPFPHFQSVRGMLGHGILLCLFMVTVLGCGSNTVHIEGTITLDGKPLPGVQILLDQPNVTGGNNFAGKTDQDGHYVLRLVGEELNGPAAGLYRVTLTTAVAERDALEYTPLPPERIPRKYRGGSLQFEVPEGGTDEADFVLTSR